MNLRISGSYIELCTKASIRAGRHARKRKEDTNIDKKDDDTYVTEADKECEDIIRKILSRETEIPIVGEEKGRNSVEKDTYWLVDPIDGTQNYAYKQPLYGSSITLIKDNTPYLCSFYMPEMDYLFYGKKDEGAYLNQDKLSVSNETDINNSYLNLSGYNMPGNISELSKELNNWIQTFSCAIQSESWVSAGWNDVFICDELRPWDLSTGTLLVREAGGVVERIDSPKNDWEYLSHGGIIMGNKEIVKDSKTKIPQELINRMTQ
jgi:myo-inositol-1(or 4)-monophosphatase